MKTKENNVKQNFANSNESVEKIEKKQKIKSIISKTVIYFILTIAAILSLAPFVTMILFSFMPDKQFQSITDVTDIFPKEFVFSNYANAFNYTDTYTGFNFIRALLNTLVVGIVSTVLGVIVVILSAFAFARLKFTGKNILFSLLLATMMIPGEMFTITNYVTVSNLEWNDTLIVLILPFLVSVYYIYLLRNNFKQIPEELYKAAKVDGVSDFKYLIKVMIPLSAPTIISITILKLIGTWNSYIWPRLVNVSPFLLLSNWMNESGMPAQAGPGDLPQQTIRMAAAVIITVPLLIVFLCFKKYVMRGVSKSGIKG